MFAVVKHGGKQYRVEPGFALVIEKFEGGIVGKEFEFDDVVLASDGIGTFFHDVKVEAVVAKDVACDKVLSFKKRRRHFGSKRMRGHRQKRLLVLVKSVVVNK